MVIVRRTARWFRNTSWMLLLVLIVCAPVIVSIEYINLAHRIADTARTSYIDSCDGQNEVRSEVVALVESTLSRSERSTKATLAAPQSTQEQINAALKNLAALRSFDAQITKTLAPRSCAYPPVIVRSST